MPAVDSFGLIRCCIARLIAVSISLAVGPGWGGIGNAAPQAPTGTSQQATEQAPSDALAERLREELRSAIDKNNYERLRSALPYLDIPDFTRLRASLKVFRSGNVEITVLPLRVSGTGLICYLSIQFKVANEPTLRDIVMVRSEGSSVAATRSVSLQEAAEMFGISRHQAGIRILVQQQMAEIVETVTLEIRAPGQRRAFFFVSDDIDQLSISVGGGARYIRQNSFILVETDQPWPTGTKIHVELRYRRPLTAEEQKKG